MGVVKAGEEGNACSKEKKQYEINCAKSWVRLLLIITGGIEILTTDILD